MPPTIRMMIDRTDAKIGRSMKKWEKRMGWASNSAGWGYCHPARGYPSLRSG
jgi:hypothetical protein